MFYQLILLLFLLLILPSFLLALVTMHPPSQDTQLTLGNSVKGNCNPVYKSMVSQYKFQSHSIIHTICADTSKENSVNKGDNAGNETFSSEVNSEMKSQVL